MVGRMNRAWIPGFYFDEEKQKYFKIQANHLVPQGAKYSKGNVKQEIRKAKKQKVDDRKQTKLYQHTVKRSEILQHAITGGAGLHREQGTHSGLANLDKRDAALTSQFRPKATRVQLPGSSTCPEIHITSATYIPSTKQMVTASSHAHTGVSALHVCSWDWDVPKLEMPHGCGFAAFHSSITSVSVAMNRDAPRVVACSRQDASTGQIFNSPVPSPTSEPTYPYQQPGVYFSVKCGVDNRLITSIHQHTGITAISTAKRIYIMNEDAAMSNSLHHPNDEYRVGVDWLDYNTVAYEANSPDSSSHHVQLWDVRTAKGVVSRFRVRNRITGLLNPCQASANGHQLLASTNHHINLYDTRVPHPLHKEDSPLLLFPHVHQGPELEFTTDGGNLMAAVDRDNVVHVFSTRSGRKMDSLVASSSKPQLPEPRMMKKLQWYDDPEIGSALQACIGNEIVRWTWGGREDDER